MREWLTVIIVLLIIGVLLDGWRRMRLSHKQSIKMSRNARSGKRAGKGELDTYGSELPNGGARVVGQRDESDARAVTESVKEGYRKRRVGPRVTRIPQQVALNLDAEVPVLMDPVAEEGGSSKSRERVEPTFSAEDLGDVEPDDVDASDLRDEYGQDDDDDDYDPLFAEPESGEDTEFEQEEPEEEAQPDEVLVINIMAADDGPFPGQELLDVLLECGMRYGDMKIFHRYADENGEGPLFFSLANMVVPGTFDLQHMADFETPGVSLFMTLPMSANSIEAFNTMALTAATVAERLGGELKDETRSAMTNQTLEHCRQRILEYERKRQLSAY